MTVDFPDWGHPQAAANAISTTGAPPLVFKQVLDVLIGQNLAANSSITRPASGQFSLNQPGYELQISFGSLGATAPIMSVELQWYDSSFGNLVDDETYFMYSGNAAGHFIHGRGPSKGDRVVVIITNNGASAVTVTYTLMQTSRTFTREFWKTIAKAGVQPVYAGFNSANSSIAANQLESASHTLAALNGFTSILPLYTGTVRLLATTSDTTPANSSWVITSTSDHLLPGSQTFVGKAGQTGFTVAGTSSLYVPEIALPRAQCQLNYSNGNSGASETLTAVIVAQEDRS